MTALRLIVCLSVCSLMQAASAEEPESDIYQVMERLSAELAQNEDSEIVDPLAPPSALKPETLGPVPDRQFTTPSPRLAAPDPSRVFAQNESMTNRVFGRSASAQRPYRPLLSAPNLFGDTTDGGCGEASLLSGITSASLEHPTFNCIRANLAENNSPLPRDRFYIRYNHFHNITDTSIFQDNLGASFPEGVTSLNVDRATIGYEFTFWDGLLSLETRVPFARQLTSDLVLYDVQGNYNLPIDDYRMELLNMQFILKALFYETETLALSGGMALNVPTGNDFNIRIFVDDDNFEVLNPNFGPTVSVDLDIYGTVANETYNLSPFLAYLWAPQPRVFTQGFAQLDLPLNEVSTVVSGTVGPAGPTQIIIPPDRGKLYQQTLMRLNLGAGYWFLQRPEAKFLQGWAGVMELHYTTTLNDADLGGRFTVPLLPIPGVTADVVVGNLANRNDILNVGVGSHFVLGGRSTLGIGIFAPMRGGSDHPFDAEVNVLFNLLL